MDRITSRHRDIKGLTLIEVIISLAILTILIGTVFTFFSFNLNSFSVSSESVDKQSTLRLVSYKLTDDLRNITSINLVNRTTTPTSSSDLYSKSDECFVLETDGIKRGEKNAGAVNESSYSDDVVTSLSFSFMSTTDPINPGRLKSSLIMTLNAGTSDEYSTEILLNNIRYAEQISSSFTQGTSYNSIEFGYSTTELTSLIMSYTSTGLAVNTSIPNGAEGTPYSHTFTATGGTTPYTFSLFGTLPSGITWDGTDSISGTPNTGSAGSYPLTITVTDSNGDTDSHSFNLVISSSTPPTMYALTVNASAGGSATGGGSYANGAVVPISATANSGYQFVNWTATSGSFANASAASTTFNMPGADATVTANFSAATYTVTFNKNSSAATDPDPSSKVVTYGSTYGTLPTITRPGKTFSGWYTAATGGTLVTSSTVVNITNNQTLYARWN